MIILCKRGNGRIDNRYRYHGECDDAYRKREGRWGGGARRRVRLSGSLTLNKRARFDCVSSTVSTNENTVRLSSPPRAFSLSLSLSHSFTHLPREGRESYGPENHGVALPPGRPIPPLSIIVEYRVYRHTQTRTYIVRIPLAIVCALYIAFFLFLSLLPSKIMQHATAVRLHTS